MGRPDLGTKFECTSCHQRSYDLNRSPVVCPRCGVQQPPRVARVVRPVRESRNFRQAPTPRIEEEVAEETVSEEVEDADDAEEIDDDAEDEIDHKPDSPDHMM